MDGANRVTLTARPLCITCAWPLSMNTVTVMNDSYLKVRNISNTAREGPNRGHRQHTRKISWSLDILWDRQAY